MMKASEAEFRHRVWSFWLVFMLGFGAYFFDRLNIVMACALAVKSSYGWAFAMLMLRTVFWAVFALMLMMAILRTWATAYLRAEVVHDKQLHSTEVVADGPYRHVRNPLYLGNLMMGIGMATMASRTGAAIIMVGVPLILLRLIGREEAELTLKGGESYRNYCAAVPRLWPSWRARVPSSSRAPDWVNGVAGESAMWMMAAAVGAFAATLNLRWFVIVFAPAFPLQAILLRAMKRGAKPQPGAAA